MPLISSRISPRKKITDRGAGESGKKVVFTLLIKCGALTLMVGTIALLMVGPPEPVAIESRTPNTTQPTTSQPSEKKDDVLIADSKTEPSFKIALFPLDRDRYVSKRIFDTGLYEPKESEFTRNVFRGALEGSWAVDVGANIGFHSLHMAALGARVICFEPSQDTADLLRTSIDLNGFGVDENASSSSKGSMRLIQAAAADEKGEGRLKRFPHSPGMTVLQRIDKGNSSKKAEELPFGLDSHVVQTGIPLVKPETILDGYIKMPENAKKLRLLKVDAEGWEMQAFKGINLSKYPFDFVALEVFPALLWKAGNTDPVDLMLHLTSFDYHCTERAKILFEIPSSLDEDWAFRSSDQVKDWYRKRVLGGKDDPQGYVERAHLNLFCKRVPPNRRRR